MSLGFINVPADIGIIDQSVCKTAPSQLLPIHRNLDIAIMLTCPDRGKARLCCGSGGDYQRSIVGRTKHGSDNVKQQGNKAVQWRQSGFGLSATTVQYVHTLVATKYYYELRYLSLPRVFVNTRTSSSFVILKPLDVLSSSNSG